MLCFIYFSISLDCNRDCALLERNRRLADALSIEDPDLESKPGVPTYSQFLKDYSKYVSLKYSLHFYSLTIVDNIRKAKKIMICNFSGNIPHFAVKQRRP